MMSNKQERSEPNITILYYLKIKFGIINQKSTFLLKFRPMSRYAGPSTTLYVFAIISRISENYLSLSRCWSCLLLVVNGLLLESFSLSLKEKLLLLLLV